MMSWVQLGELPDTLKPGKTDVFMGKTLENHGNMEVYPPVKVHTTLENHSFLLGKLPISMAMFNSYV